MDAGTLSIRNIFEQDRRHIVPLFQRPYVWRRETQWEPLWNDVSFLADNILAGRQVRPHFLGAIVLDQRPTQTGHVEMRLVIDGQQRLTTIQLLLEAFFDVCAHAAVENYQKALFKLVRNDDPLSSDPDEMFKVWPTNNDRENFRRVMAAGSPEELRLSYALRANAVSIGNQIGDGYMFFHGVVAAWLALDQGGAQERLKALYTTVRDHLRMVVIDLGEQDDAQLIFETLNARGTPLLPSDLVKNFLFHRAQAENDDPEPLYDRYWRSFDSDGAYWRAELGRGHAKRARVDIFLQHLLTLKTAEEVSVAHLYSTFKDFTLKGAASSAKEILTEIARYAKTYRSFDRQPPDSREHLFFERLAVMETTTAFPFLLELFSRHGSDKQQLTYVLLDVESFLVRRMVCQLSTRGYNRFFIELLQAINAGGADVRATVREFLMKSDAESARWPSDAEFGRAWTEDPIYRRLQRSRVRLVLEAIERQLRSKKTEMQPIPAKLTIEHLLPQAWRQRQEWSLPTENDAPEAEARRDNLVQTLGNLTLLTSSLNPSVSNGPWITNGTRLKGKREAILKHTLLRLNNELQDYTEWNEETIRGRGAKMFGIAAQLWPHPD